MSTPRRRRTQSGGSMVEVSLCLVPFLMFLFGTISLGHAMFAYNNVSFLAREGSRWASVRGSGSAAVATEAQVAAYTKGKAAGLDLSKLAVATTWSNAAKTPGSRVTVEVTYPAMDLLMNIIDQPITLRGTSTATILQ